MGNSTVLKITDHISIADSEYELRSVRAQGPGGQHVNKTSTAIHLRFDIEASSLPDDWKERLLALKDRRISKGIVVIKAQRYRSRERNCDDARERLRVLLLRSAQAPKDRKATKPSKAVRQKRLDAKARQGIQKQLRARVRTDEE